mgnify:CR=1 FL=1
MDNFADTMNEVILSLMPETCRTLDNILNRRGVSDEEIMSLATQLLVIDTTSRRVETLGNILAAGIAQLHAEGSLVISGLSKGRNRK